MRRPTCSTAAHSMAFRTDLHTCMATHKQHEQEVDHLIIYSTNSLSMLFSPLGVFHWSYVVFVSVGQIKLHFFICFCSIFGLHHLLRETSMHNVKPKLCLKGTVTTQTKTKTLKLCFFILVALQTTVYWLAIVIWIQKKGWNTSLVHHAWVWDHWSDEQHNMKTSSLSVGSWEELLLLITFCFSSIDQTIHY